MSVHHDENAAQFCGQLMGASLNLLQPLDCFKGDLILMHSHNLLKFFNKLRHWLVTLRNMFYFLIILYVYY
ncbi:MAG TPA: hypothetical protein DCQ84_02320 [Candidatus Competibacteraceae bacterium]|nr:hypothetical protein [Candidatus Competibacteraceae bacterium]